MRAVHAHQAKQRRRSAFTLIEVMVSVALSTLVLAGMTAAAVHYYRSYENLQVMGLVRQNVLVAMNTLTRDLRGAGYGMTCSAAEMPLWTTWVGGTTGCIMVASGPGGTNSVRMVGVSAEPDAFLSADAAAGATTLNLAGGVGPQFNAAERRLVFLGGLQLARITALNSGQIVVSCSATNSAGIRYNLPAGSRVTPLRVATYLCGTDTSVTPARHYLRRNSHVAGLDLKHEIVAYDIESFSVEPLGNKSFRVTVTGRSPQPDPGYTDPVQGDHYRRESMSTDVWVRNSG